MSISNQTEACYLRTLNGGANPNDNILICRGDFCLLSLIGGGGGDNHVISSCETTITVLELEEKSSFGMVDNLSPLYITLLIIIFIILFLAIVIMIMKKRSKNRNNSDNNYFATTTSRRDDNNHRSFCQIETPEKFVENAIRKTIRDCYPTAKFPAYEKQLFIFESDVKETEFYNLKDVATHRRNLSELLVNEIDIRHSLMLMESILSRVETYYIELLSDQCKPYQMEVRSKHVLVDGENQIFVKLFATERISSSSSSDQAVKKIKSDLIAMLEKILKKTKKAPTSSSPRVSEESTGKSSSGYSTGGSNDEESSRLLSPTQVEILFSAIFRPVK